MQQHRLPRNAPAPRWRACSLALAAGLGGLACAAPPARPLERIQALIGEAPCDADAQCRSLGVGAQPCGGPSRYLAWSTRGTDAAALQALAGQLAQDERTAQQAEGRVSHCMVLPDPGAHCVATPAGGRCQLRPAAPPPR